MQRDILTSLHTAITGKIKKKGSIQDNKTSFMETAMKDAKSSKSNILKKRQTICGTSTNNSKTMLNQVTNKMFSNENSLSKKSSLNNTNQFGNTLNQKEETTQNEDYLNFTNAKNDQEITEKGSCSINSKREVGSNMVVNEITEHSSIRLVNRKNT
jgi:hypothetical protein